MLELHISSSEWLSNSWPRLTVRYEYTLSPCTSYLLESSTACVCNRVVSPWDDLRNVAPPAVHWQLFHVWYLPCIPACWSGAIYPTVYSFYFSSWIWILLNFSLVLWIYAIPFHIELVTPNTVHLLKCMHSSIIAADTLMLEKIEGKKRSRQQRMR